MSKLKGRKPKAVTNNAATSYDRGIALLSQYTENTALSEPLPEEEAIILLENAIAHFSLSKTHYADQTELTRSSQDIALAEASLKKGEALSHKASYYQGKREYEKAINTYKESASELFYAQNMYSSYLGGRDSKQCYSDGYLAMVALANNYAARSECHDQLEDFIGASKWRGVALKQLSGIRTGYASYLSTDEGRGHDRAITALEEEMRTSLQENEPKIIVQETQEQHEKRPRNENSEAITWRDKLRGPAAFVSLPARDWVNYAQSSKRVRLNEERGASL